MGVRYYICKQSFINFNLFSMQSIIMHDATIRGDFSHITINRYCFIDEGSLLRPSRMPSSVPVATHTLSHTPASSSSSTLAVLSQEDPSPDAKYVPMHIGELSSFLPLSLFDCNTSINL